MNMPGLLFFQSQGVTENLYSSLTETTLLPACEQCR